MVRVSICDRGAEAPFVETRDCPRSATPRQGAPNLFYGQRAGFGPARIASATCMIDPSWCIANTLLTTV